MAIPLLLIVFLGVYFFGFLLMLTFLAHASRRTDNDKPAVRISPDPVLAWRNAGEYSSPPQTKPIMQVA